MIKETHDEIVILSNGIDIAGNSVDSLNEGSCDNFISFSPNITYTPPDPPPGN